MYRIYLMPKYIFTLLLFSYAFIVTAQPVCTSKTFSVKEGLTTNLITDIKQTQVGMLWLSSWNGLYSYDGYTFTSFKENPNQKQILSTRSLTSMKINKYGDIWCKTYDNRIYLFDCEKCEFIDVSKLIKEKSGISAQIGNFYSLPNGHTWITFRGGKYLRIDDSKIKSGEGIETFGSKGQIANKIEEDNKGREWIFSNKWLSLYRNKFHHPSHIDYMCQDGKYVYFASPEGYFGFYLPGFRRLKAVTLPQGASKISEITSIGGGRIAIASNIGILIYNRNNGLVRTISIQLPSQPSPSIKKMFVDSHHRIWAFPKDADGVILISANGDNRKWMQAMLPDKTSETTSKEPFFHEDRNGVIWIIPNGGTYSYYDERKHNLEPFRLETNSGDNRTLPHISKYFVDSKGNAWVTGLHNITILCFEQQNFIYHDLNNDDARALSYDKNGNLLVGTYNGKLIIIDKTGNWIFNKKISTSGIYTIFIDSKNRLWIGTKGDGIFLAYGNYRNLSIKRFIHKDTDKWSLGNNNIYDINEDTHGRIIIGTYGEGLNIVDEADGKIRFLGSHNILQGFGKDCINVRRLTVTGNGVILAATNGGIVTYSDRYVDPSHIRFYHSRHIQGKASSILTSEVMLTFPSRTGKIFVSTRGGGIQTIETKNLLQDNLKLKLFEMSEKDEGTLQSFLEDNNGYIWMIRESSIDRYDSRNGKFDIYDSNNIPEGTAFTESRPAYLPALHTVVVGVNGGIMTFDPENIHKSNYCPKIVFTKVQYQGEIVTCPILGMKLLDIPADKRDITVYFSALDYSINNNIRYAYRIEGVDREWNYTDKTHSASLAHLQAGHYTLVVKSTNADGVWMNNETRLDFHVQPHIWETTWAMIIYLALAILLVYYALLVYRRHNREIMERQMNEQRLNFYTDISHQLRTPLTLILGPVKEVIDNEPLTEISRKYLTFVLNNSKRMLSLLNQALDLKKMQEDNGHVDLSPDDILDNENQILEHVKPITAEELLRPERKVRLLIVEDNDELRYYLFNALARDYDVMEARNGEEGLDMAVNRQPEFIITDIMMPEMDGMTMIRRIKADHSVCHIPIIVLSAKTAMIYKIEGMKEGIDDYITKPFSVEYLKSRMHNIIEKRRSLQQAYINNLSTTESNDEIKLNMPEMDNTDKTLIRKIVNYLNENAANSELRVADIARNMGLSQTVLYGKMKSIVGMAPGDFLRHVRMEKAKQMVATTQLSFAEIAFAVGFADPKYFSRCFKSDIGMTAKEYRTKYKK